MVLSLESKAISTFVPLVEIDGWNAATAVGVPEQSWFLQETTSVLLELTVRRNMPPAPPGRLDELAENATTGPPGATAMAPGQFGSTPTEWAGSPAAPAARL